MDIKQALKKKNELEKQIAEMLLKFTEETEGLVVGRIDIDAMKNMANQVIRYQVEVDIRL